MPEQGRHGAQQQPNIPKPLAKFPKPQKTMQSHERYDNACANAWRPVSPGLDRTSEIGSASTTVAGKSECRPNPSMEHPFSCPKPLAPTLGRPRSIPLLQQILSSCVPLCSQFLFRDPCGGECFREHVLHICSRRTPREHIFSICCAGRGSGIPAGVRRRNAAPNRCSRSHAPRQAARPELGREARLQAPRSTVGGGTAMGVVWGVMGAVARLVPLACVSCPALALAVATCGADSRRVDRFAVVAAMRPTSLSSPERSRGSGPGVSLPVGCHGYVGYVSGASSGQVLRTVDHGGWEIGHEGWSP